VAVSGSAQFYKQRLLLIQAAKETRDITKVICITLDLCIACEAGVLCEGDELELRVSWAAWEEERGEPEAAWNVLALAAIKQYKKP
jgi:hypothetical protein